MSRLTPLQIETVEGEKKSAAASPFPVLGGGISPQAGSIAPMGTVSSEAAQVNQLEQMLRDAQGRAESVEREAYDKAYAAGEKAGLALGKKRAEQIVESMEVSLRQVESESSHLRRNCVDAVVEIAQVVVEQLMGEVISNQKGAIFQAATRAAEQLPEISELKLAVHPDDYQTFERLVQDERPDWRLYIDANVAQGTCRLVSKHQDALIDPVRAVAESIQQIRIALHSAPLIPAGEERGGDNPVEL